YPDPEVKEDARQRKLKLMLAAVEPAPMVLSWHCVLCKRDYDGERHCRTFGTGIYSTELNLKTASPS
ncbi:TPA: putative zinc ribbon protein, partial [Citrobacter braakii]